MDRARLAPALALGAALVFTSLCSAATVTLNTGQSPFLAGTNNQGWWSNTLSNTDANDFWQIGVFQETVGLTFHDTRAFFTFDLSDVTAHVVEAHLRLTTTGYESPDALENVELFDVSTDAATLNNTQTATGNADIYADLGGGTSFGQFVVDQPAEGTGNFQLEWQLNAEGVAALNAARGGFFSIGASLTSIGSALQAEEIIRGQAGSPQSLDLVGAIPPPGGVIPLPPGVFGGLAMLGMLGVSGIRRLLPRR